MKREFHVTALGPSLDGRMIMPGSVLVLNSEPPSHWQRFGDVKRIPEKSEAPKEEVKEPEMKEVEVATPDNDDLEELQALYEQEKGEAPDGRWGTKKLKKELGLD